MRINRRKMLAGALALGGGRRRGLGAAQDGVDAQHQFLGVEGPGEVVVGPGLQAGDAVGHGP